MNHRGFPSGVVLLPAECETIDLRRRCESRILRAYGIGRAEMMSAKRPALFDEIETGQAFVVKDHRSCFVCCKMNDHNAAGGDNCVVLGGKIFQLGRERDFSTEGSLIAGIRAGTVVFPIPGKVFGPRERRSMRRA